MKKLGKIKVNVKKKVSIEQQGLSHCYESLLVDDDHDHDEEHGATSANSRAPTGFLAMYVGEERRRFVVPMSYLSHPLFKILLEKAHDEFGFQQRQGLVMPCSVNEFKEVVNAVETCHGRFDFGKLFKEFI
ncbi:auxin-responsive protein SAUR19-like [Impatiens glandulifera]|uniref:auxin-responsive protein SAUR19-like n=1 Tax=Impatiens glandulifera TaxID=253017 RepID=UPI001FB17AD8|nr:auxin-responsive protein SAUR19-like [Impatiens glandulifera]